MPVPTDTLWNIKRLNIVFAASSIILMAVIGWTIIQDYDKGWRVPQKNGRVWEAALTDEKIHRALTPEVQKHVDELKGVQFDYVVTVCDHANETCPFFPGKTKIIHVGFDDPPRLAKSAASEEEALGHYRRVRDEIRAFVETLPGSLEKPR